MARTQPIISISKVSFAYKDGEEIFKNLSLEINSNERVAILGRSGCGKTTLIKLLAGYIAPQSGVIKIKGSASRLPRQSIVMSQENDIFDWLTVEQNMRLVSNDKRKNEYYLSVVGLEEVVNHRGGKLSVGMKKRLSFARALAAGTDILILDEPFSSLDYLRRERLYDELLSISEKEGQTVLLVTHDIDEAVRLCDKIYYLHDRPCSIEKISVDKNTNSKDKVKSLWERHEQRNTR